MSFIRQRLAKVAELAGAKSPIELFTTSLGLRLIFDGNLFETIVVHGPTGKLVGQDDFGNKYFESPNGYYNRKRWVVYADIKNYNPSGIPPEWHGWLNYVNDYAPTEYDFKKPIFYLPATVAATGTEQRYHPKGSWFNPNKRNWQKYEAWPRGHAAQVQMPKS